MLRLLFIALLALVPPGAAAQRAFSPSPGFSGLPSGRFLPRFHLGVHFRPAYYPLVFDPFYSDGFTRSEYVSAPPVIILQAPPATVPENAPTHAQPLMIELQGDRYVRVSGEETSAAQMIDQVPATKPPSRFADVTPSPLSRQQRIPALLVFRDGHREEVSDYTIAGGVLYAAADYYSSGSWTRKIELASLNLSETVNSNQSRGLRFQLPSAPNEVIIGP